MDRGFPTEGVELATVKHYQEATTRLMPTIGTIKLQPLTALGLDVAYASLLDAGRAARTDLFRALARVFASFGYEWVAFIHVGESDDEWLPLPAFVPTDVPTYSDDPRSVFHRRRSVGCPRRDLNPHPLARNGF